MERAEKSPKSDLPASVRRMRGIQRRRPPASVISFDEMWTYLNTRSGEGRSSVFIWTAIVEESDGTRWADYEVGGRDAETFMRLRRRLPGAAVYHRSDDYSVYASCLPSERHVAEKGEAVNRNEGLRSKLRGKLNRLVRRTKGYSKSLTILTLSLAMVWVREGLNICAWREYQALPWHSPRGLSALRQRVPEPTRLTVTKPAKDLYVSEVAVYRYRCCDCTRTFRHPLTLALASFRQHDTAVRRLLFYKCNSLYPRFSHIHTT